MKRRKMCKKMDFKKSVEKKKEKVLFFHFLPCFLFLLFLPISSYAEIYEIDPQHSSVEFKVRHLVGKVSGSFNEFSGTVDFDEANPDASKIDTVIKADSIDTRIPDRDKHLKTADFFDTTAFPEAKFVSKSVDSKAGKITGELTLHGVTKPVELTYTYGGKVTDKWGNVRIGGSGEGKINRRDFGITYDPTGVTIGDEVELRLEIEAILKSA